jgi:isopentenyl phosphate kinase
LFLARIRFDYFDICFGAASKTFVVSGDEIQFMLADKLEITELFSKGYFEAAH